MYDGLITNGASVLMTNFGIFAKRTLSKTLFEQFTAHIRVMQLRKILLPLFLDILYESHLTNLNKEAATKYGNSHLEIFCNRRSLNLTRN